MSMRSRRTVRGAALSDSWSHRGPRSELGNAASCQHSCRYRCHTDIDEEIARGSGHMGTVKFVHRYAEWSTDLEELVLVDVLLPQRLVKDLGERRGVVVVLLSGVVLDEPVVVERLWVDITSAHHTSDPTR
eukprot:836518-Rhodomonas_salina.3